MEQKTKRIALMLMSMMAMCPFYADTAVTLDGLKYSLSGAFASVSGIAEGNVSEVITVPATIVYDNLQYTVNGISDAAFAGDNSWWGGYNNNNNVKEVYLPNTI